MTDSTSRLRGAAVAVLVAPIRFYRALVSPMFPAACRFQPTCSQYAVEAVQVHGPLKGFQMTGQSFKSRDAHANLQVTFQRRLSDGAIAGDIDIDESTGFEHGLEVIRNAVLNKRTNPYLIREFLLLAEPREHTLDPGYRFTF